MSVLLTKFKQFYEGFNKESIQTLDSIYADHIVFSDPVHEIHGLDKLTAYFDSMCGKLSECHFEFVEEMVQADKAFYKWKMFYRHPSINNNERLQLTGVSLITYSDKIDAHEDIYDMGAMLYEHIPVMGAGIRMLKSKIIKNV